MTFDQAVAQVICEAVAASDLGLFALLKSRTDLPRWHTVERWKRENPPFAEALSRARELRLERIADSLVELSDEGRGAPAEVAAIKLQLHARQWLLSKLAAHTYGDKLDLTSKGEALQAPVQAHSIDARIQSIVLNAQRRAQEAAVNEVSLRDEARALLE